ncbi:hypothetical protein QQ045_012688 [Rhodiola kirilowii]
MDDLDSTNSSDQHFDWFGSHFLANPTFCWEEDPYNIGNINSLSEYLAWDPSHEEDQQMIHNTANSVNSTTTSTGSPILAVLPNDLSPSPTTEISKERKSVDDPVPKVVQTQNGKCHNRQRKVMDPSIDQEVVSVKKQNGGKKKPGRSSVNSNNCNNGRDGRWAEQLLNPCAAAITAGNLTRMQHLILVLRELGSATGDPNHRLALHGLKALTHHISPTPASSVSSFSFASTEPKFFQKSLLKFYEVSPWFIFPNTIANFSILQILEQGKNSSQNLHILDIGVSHGIQWPTLLEALSKQPGGPPPVVRITVVAATAESDESLHTPFAIGPPGHRFSTSLLSFAKTLNINLKINHLNNIRLHNLNTQIIDSSESETLIVSAQFRLHSLNHKATDERAEVLKVLRNLNPKGLILSENNMDCSCSDCGDFATGFGRRVDYLWKFLDSTSSAFKGRECDERQVLEGEAAKALIHIGEMNEGKDKWCERMRDAGFVGEVLDEDVVVDAGKLLLRKYDCNWEMRVGDKDGCVGICWKGQPVSFCSLWKLNSDVETS